MKVSGLILAGGQSRRMGRPKALLEVDTRLLVEVVRDRLAPHCTEILLSVRPDRDPVLDRITGVRLVPDDPRHHGPLAGIRAGLAAAAESHVLVVGCDMPWLHAGALELVREQDPRWDVVIPVAGGHLQPLHARYATSCLPAVDRVLAGGPGPVARFFPEVQVKELDECQWSAVPGFAASLTSLDTPARWRDFLSRRPARNPSRKGD
jgi:molybdopterin-guanine dinucleotide biosynthesis protein A